MLYYVFENEEMAIAAEQQISILGGVPLIGTNALTNEPEPEKCQTVRWAEPKQRLDGKWVFPKVPTEILDLYPDEILDDFNNTFPYVFEMYRSDWFPIIEEEDE